VLLTLRTLTFMHLLKYMFSALLVFGFSSTLYAGTNKADLFDACVRSKNNENYCKCAMGKPYDEVLAVNVKNKVDILNRVKDGLKVRYKKAYDLEISKGGLIPSQIQAVCDVINDYYKFREDNGLPYKKVGKRNLLYVDRNDIKPMTSDIRQALTVKSTETRKRIQDLNNKYQRNGAMGSFSNINGGACVIKNKIKWLDEEIKKLKNLPPQIPVYVAIGSLLEASKNTCSHLE